MLKLSLRSQCTFAPGTFTVCSVTAWNKATKRPRRETQLNVSLTPTWIVRVCPWVAHGTSVLVSTAQSGKPPLKAQKLHPPRHLQHDHGISGVWVWLMCDCFSSSNDWWHLTSVKTATTSGLGQTEPQPCTGWIFMKPECETRSLWKGPVPKI